MRVTVLRNGTRVPKSASQLRNTLRNGALAVKLGIFTLWDFAAISQLRNEGYCAAKWHSCAKSAFTAAKSSAEWDFWCEIRLYHFTMRFAAAKWMLLCCEVALVCQKWFRSCENFHREGYWVANWFPAKCRFRRGCEISQTPVVPLFLPCFCSDFAPKDFLQFLCNSS